MTCPNLEKNKKNCTCQATTCIRYGRCCECVNYHRAKGGKPDCLR